MSSPGGAAWLAICAVLWLVRGLNGAGAHFCTAGVCQLCCKATSEGCVNAFRTPARGTMMGGNLACEQCNCDNPQIGCGWVGRRFKRVDCTSCDIIDTMLQRNPDLPTAGCGMAVVDGALIYTS